MTQVINDSLISHGTNRVSSISGYGLLLEEESIELKEYALKELNTAVDGHWFEMVEYLGSIETCFEDELFPNRELAALLASKIYFHMEDYDEALKYLLSSYKLFDPMENSSYSESMVVKCIDEFIKICRLDYNNRKEDLIENSNIEIDGLDKRLSELVTDLISRSTSNNNYMNAIGIVIESRRGDLLYKILKEGMNSPKDQITNFFRHCLKSIEYVDSNKFKLQCYTILLNLIEEMNEFDENLSIRIYCECLCYTGNKDKLARTLFNLLKKEDTVLTAYSIAFLLQDHENSLFSLDLANLIDKIALEYGFNINDNREEIKEIGIDGIKLNVKYLKNLRYILVGEATIDLYLQFLYLNNQPDLGILEYIKNNYDQRSTITHTALVMAHGLMQAGTTCDLFLRNNLEWLGKATHWSRFSTAASLGVVHMGHIKESFKVLSTCLPSNNNGDSTNILERRPNNTNTHGGQYSEGGSFYALGLIHMNHVDLKAKNYLIEQLNNSQRNEILQHGACLGLGIMCMSTCDNQLFEELRNILYMDNAVAGEAAAYALGMVMFGSGSKKVINDLISYAKDTQHEKIIRACSIAIGLLMYGKCEEANELFFQLNSDNEHFIRLGGIYVLGLAYCGTGNEFALEKLLHSCVSELSDDNRRAAVFAIGMVLCRDIQQIPQIFNLLCDSYNPHVRYAAALTLGMTCCGTGSSKIISILNSMTNDSIDFVRQAAYIALGMLIMQQNDHHCDKLNSIRQRLIKASTDKHEHITTRFGAILGIGLADAGGRNVIATLFSNTGYIRPKAVIGFTLFYQFWYWFPLVHCISLTYSPTYVIGIDQELRIPKSFKMICNANIDRFDYPKSFSIDKSEDKKVVVTAILSTASKKKSKKNINHTSMSIEKKDMNDGKLEHENYDLKQEDLKIDHEKVDIEMQSESNKDNDSFILNNPFRVTSNQEQFLEFIPNSRFTPIFPEQKTGFILLRDNNPSEKEDYIEVIKRDHENHSFKEQIDKKEDEKVNKSDKNHNDSDTDQHIDKDNTDNKAFDNNEHDTEVVPPETFEWQG